MMRAGQIASAARREAADAPDWPTPVRVALPGPGSSPCPVVFASPHSGTVYPEDMRAQLNVPLIELKRTEDAHVDAIFATAPRQGATLVSAVFARTFVDLNRAAHELDPELIEGAPTGFGKVSDRVRAGLGCVPRVAAAGRDMYRGRLAYAEVCRRLEHVHAGYHRTLAAEVARARGGDSQRRVVLIDCHSMPSAVRRSRALPDIVLGDRYGQSCSHRLISAVERTFRKLGYSVARNSPYAGGYTTEHYGRPDAGVHALQIEINRRLYLDEARVAPLDTLPRLAEDVSKVISVVCGPSLLARL